MSKKNKKSYKATVVKPAMRLLHLLELLDRADSDFLYVKAWAVIEKDGSFSCALDTVSGATDCLSTDKGEKVVEVTICIPKGHK